MSLCRWKPAIWALLLCCCISPSLLPQAVQPAGQRETSERRTLARTSSTGRFLAQRGIVPGRVSQDSILPPAELRLRARRQHLAMPQVSTPLNAPWQSIGPQQVTTAAYGPVTGRVAAVAADPSDPSGNTVYIGTTGGGVWKSTNAAADPASVKFAPLTDQLTGYGSNSLVTISIGALTVQPGGSGVVIAGTGDPNDALDSFYGSGILRSIDGGSTWTQIRYSRDGWVSGVANFSFVGEGFAGFAWSTANPSLVVAAVTSSGNGTEVRALDPVYSTAGLYYSTDAGATWFLATITDGPNQIIQAGNRIFAAGGNAATAITWNPIRKKFYAAIRYHGYYESADGITFTRLANQPGINLVSQLCPSNPGGSGSPSCPIFRGAIAAQPVTGDMFALTIDVNDLDQGLWQDVCSLTNGSCYAATVGFKKQLSSAVLEAGQGDTTIAQGDYNLGLTAVPSQQDTLLFAGTEDIFRCSLAMNCVWRNTTNVNTCSAAKVAPSQHAMDATFASSQLLYFGNDGGVWRSADAVAQQAAACSADDAAHFQNLNSGLGSLAEVTQFAQQPDDADVIIAGFGANGTAATAQAQAAWPQVLDGEGSYVAIDLANASTWYASSANGVSINQCALGTDCGSASFGFPVVGDAQVGGDSGDLISPAPWILDPQNSSNLIVGTCRVWRGPASGNSWSTTSVISPMLDGDNAPFCNGNADVRSLAASGQSSDAATTPEYIYAGMAGRLDGGATAPGHIFRASILPSANTPPAWTDLYHSPVSNGTTGHTQFNPGAFDVSSIVLDPHDPTGQTLYVSIQGFSTRLTSPTFYRSVDAGDHWLAISNNIPDSPANSVVVDPNDANTVYVALDTGIYITRDITSCSTPGIGCWSIYGAGLPDAPVTQLAVFQSPLGGYLRAATYGRGIWQVPLATSVVTQTSATLSPTSLSFPAQPLQSASASQSVTVTNTGSIPLAITRVSISGDFTEQNTCSQPIPPQSTCTVQVTFVPAQTGARSGVMTVFANLASGQVSATLSGTGVPGGAIVLTPASMSFASLLVGTTSPSQYMTIANTGVVSIGLQTPKISGDFQVSANTCTATLTANTACTVAVLFAPSASGARTGTLTIADDVGVQTEALSGIGLSQPTDTLTPTRLAFAAQIVGTTSPGQQITLSNSGDSPLKLINTQTSGDFVASNACGNSLIGHSACAFTITYAPSRIGSVNGTLTVTDMLGTQTVALTGIGLAPPGISASPRNVDFGSQGVSTNSVPQMVTLTNNGGVDLLSLGSSLTGDFLVSTNTCGATLPVGGACQLAVVFSPTQTGSRAGSLTLSSPTLPAPLLVSLAGVGEDFQLLVAGANSATITSGQSASYTLQLVPLAGSNGTVTFACSGAPTNATCSLNPASAQMVSGTTQSLTVNVATGVAPITSSLNRARSPLAWRPLAFRGFLLACCLPLGLTGVFGRRARWLPLALSATLLLCAGGCGASASGGASPPPPPPPTPVHATPSGTYILTVTGSAPGLQRTAKLTLIVE